MADFLSGCRSSSRIGIPHQSMGISGRAMEAGERAVSGSAARTYRIGNALVELERYEEAENVFQDAANRWPDNEQVLLRLVNVTYQSLHWPEALASLENALTRFPDSSNLWLKYGDLLLDLYEFEKAERVFLTAMENWPDSPTTYEKYARVAQRSGCHIEALKRWKACVEKFPDRIPCHINYGYKINGLWRFEEAASIFSEALIKWPGNKQILARPCQRVSVGAELEKKYTHMETLHSSRTEL